MKSTQMYCVVSAIGLLGKKLLPPAQIELTPARAQPWLNTGSLRLADVQPEQPEQPALPADLDREAAAKHLAGLKLDQLKALAVELQLELGEATTKAEIGALILDHKYPAAQ